MSWSPLLTKDGSWTLVHPVHEEACHSRAGAWQQACERYAGACRIGERASGSFRLLDVGTGIGLNLAAALRALEGRDATLAAVSLELDAGVIEAGFALEQPPEVARWLAPVQEALRLALRGAGEVPLGRGTVRLLLGDARTKLAELPEAAGFDAVFLDPFSSRVEPELWEPEVLRAIARRMAPGSLLSTYTASLRVRVGLAAAGLRVGPGARVGTKGSGTIAGPNADLAAFDARTRRRIERRVRDLVHGSETPQDARSDGDRPGILAPAKTSSRSLT